jgi:hypothetical protein
LYFELRYQTKEFKQVTIANSNDELQMTVNEPNKIIRKYDMKITPSKTKAMGFCGGEHKKGQTRN